MATPVQITFDCADPDALAGFWAGALGYVVQPPPEGFDSWPEFLASVGVPEAEQVHASAAVDPDGDGPRLFFQMVPEAKATKNRVHLDVNVGGPHGTPPEERAQTVDAKVDDLVDQGASVVSVAEMREERWVVMTDPEGNEFCVQ